MAKLLFLSPSSKNVAPKKSSSFKAKHILTLNAKQNTNDSLVSNIFRGNAATFISPPKFRSCFRT